MTSNRRASRRRSNPQDAPRRVRARSATAAHAAVGATAAPRARAAAARATKAGNRRSGNPCSGCQYGGDLLGDFVGRAARIDDRDPLGLRRGAREVRGTHALEEFLALRLEAVFGAARCRRPNCVRGRAAIPPAPAHRAAASNPAGAPPAPTFPIGGCSTPPGRGPRPDRRTSHP